MEFKSLLQPNLKGLYALCIPKRPGVTREVGVREVGTSGKPPWLLLEIYAGGWCVHVWVFVFSNFMTCFPSMGRSESCPSAQEGRWSG